MTSKAQRDQMRRIGICCVLSLLLIAAVGRAAPLGASRSASTAASKLHNARVKSGGVARRAAVLFGDRTVQRTVGRAGPDRAEAFPFAVRRAGTVSAVSVYVDAHNRAKKLIVAVYSSRSRDPFRRVASGTLSSPKAGSWNKVRVTRAKVRSPSTYWIAVLGQNGTLYFRDHKNRSCQAKTYDKPHLASLPRMWTSKTRLNACPISAYATGATTTTLRTVVPVEPDAPPGKHHRPRSAGWGADACGRGLHSDA